MIDQNPKLLALADELVALEDEERVRVWRAAMESGFEGVPGDTRFCVRRSEVVDHLAKALGVRVQNNPLFTRVARLARSMGWEPVKNGGRSLFRGVKRRGMSDTDALALSRANRRDPRYPQSAEGKSLALAL